jgi:hypothetical protein
VRGARLAFGASPRGNGCASNEIWRFAPLAAVATLHFCLKLFVFGA